jgi:hypothetical protein
MRRFLLACVVVCVAAELNRPMFAAEVDEILARARKVQLGDEDMSNAEIVLKIKGTIILDKERPTFTGDFTARSTERDKLILHLDFGGPKIHYLLRSSPNQANYGTDGDVGKLTPNQYIQMKRTFEPIRKTLFAAMLNIRVERMTDLGDRESLGRRVVGMLGRNAGEPDHTLYFDKELGCLLKIELPEQQFGTTHVEIDMVFSGHTDKIAGGAAERTLTQGGVKIEGAAVAEYLLRRSLGRPAEEKIKALIVKLGDDEFTVREQAAQELTEMGPSALPALKVATKAKDAEVARRAKAAIEEIGQGNVNATILAAIHVLTRLRPANATEALLNSLGTEDEEVATEVRAALVALARRDGKIDPFLEKALTDKDARKRAAAEAALGKDGGTYLKKPGRRLYPGKCLFPARATILADGRTIAEIEFVEVQFFNRLEDRAFEEP